MTPAPTERAPAIRSLRVAVGFGAATAIAAAAAYLGTELAMAPPDAERNRLIAMYVAVAAAVFVVGLALLAVTRRSLSRRILAVGLAGPLVVAITTVVGAWTMFLSAHDTEFIIILTALATVLSVLMVSVLSGPLVRDLGRISGAATVLGQGDLAERTGIARADELGEVASTFDSMAEQLEQAAADRDRLEGERRFMLSSLSHDARTPLTAMRAAVEALQDGMAPDPDRYLHSIEQDLTEVEAIVENLFLIGQMDAEQLALRIEPIDLAALAHRAALAIEPLASTRHVDVRVEAEDTVLAAASVPETERVMSNLLANAIRHAPSGGKVDISVTAEDESSVALVQVLDDGPGFDPAFVANAFEPFARADPARTRSHGGAGLGLAVVLGLVEAQQGRVWAEPGPGGHVSFELPLATAG